MKWEDRVSNWWLLPTVAIISIWIGAGLGIVRCPDGQRLQWEASLMTGYLIALGGLALALAIASTVAAVILGARFT
jgi:hypothetical protein